MIPKQVYRVLYYLETYACKECEKKTGYANIAQVRPPRPLMKHSLASPSAVADVMTQKYADGIPLYRQEKIWKRDGVALSRATLANWVNPGQLGDPVCPDLAEASVSTDAESIAGRDCHLCG